MAESVRLRPHDPSCEPPPCPPFFDGRYVLPQHRVKLLETTHPHERDARIEFYEEPHIYTIDGVPAQESVSALAAEFESHFDPGQGILAMKRSRRNRWPRLEYVRNARQVTSVEDLRSEEGTLVVNDKTGTTVSSFLPGQHDASGEKLLEHHRNRYLEPVELPDERYFVYERPLTDEEIVELWARHGEDARNRGTEAHLQMELWFNSEPVRMEEGEVKAGLAFVEKCLAPISALAYRTEWTIFGEDENVAGCIDLAVVLPSGALYLVDWKRSEKLASKMRGYSRMRAPLDHLDDCAGCAYALQLGCYQYILEKYYGFTVSGRALCSIHPSKPFTTAVPYLKNEVEHLMARRRCITACRKELAAKHPDLCCAFSGLLVMEAVRDEAGGLYDAKSAKLREILATPCPETTSRARALIEESMPRLEMGDKTLVWSAEFAPTDDLMAFTRP